MALRLTPSEVDTETEFSNAWRQIVRWLVADVPRRGEIDIRRMLNQPGQPVQIETRVRDELYESLDNAEVKLDVTPPNGRTLQLTAEPSDRAAGLYTATYVPHEHGAYRASITVTGPSGEAN